MLIEKRFLKIVGPCAVLALASLLYLFVYEPRYKGHLSHDEDTLVFAHRGLGNHAPDNSLEGAEIALRHGLEGVDVDGQFSADKQVVIFHDVSLERFTTGTGRVDSKTVEELKAFDLSVKFPGEDFSNVNIATFEEFVQTVIPRGYLMVELKVPGVADTGIEQQVNEIIKKHDAYDRVLLSSFNPIVLYRLKQVDSRIKTVFIFKDSGWDPKRVAETRPEDRVSLPWYLRTEITRVAIRKIIKPDALSINQEVDAAVIDKLLAKGHPIFLWSLNDEQSIRWALHKRPYGIISDEPLLAKQIRDSFQRD